VLALLDAAGIEAYVSGAASGPPQVRTVYGILCFEDDGTIRAKITRHPALHVVP
jgi:hypothetical protein